MANANFILSFWIILRVFCYSLEYRTYRCQNGTYIGSKLVCDGKSDCANDDEDENDFLCKSKEGICSPGTFLCKFKPHDDNPSILEAECKNATSRCNTIRECSYRSDVDEWNCDEDEVNIDNCRTERGKYLCSDLMKCIDYQYTCDGFCNCFDCSDERPGCQNDGYLDNSVSKSHTACFKTPNGPACCSDFDSACQRCDNNSKLMCDQICVQYAKQSRCICGDDHIGIPNTNNTKCTLKNNIANENLLLYSTKEAIKVVNLFTNERVIIKGLTNCCTVLTGAHEFIYYTIDEYDDNLRNYTLNNARILKTSRISKETFETVKSDQIITSIAIDWITNNIYYTTSSSLSVCSNNGEYCSELKSNAALNSIYLAPKFGLMFWISQDLVYSIMKSSMNGYNDQAVLNFYDPTSIKLIAVDELKERIFLYDASKSEIRSLTFNGEIPEVWRSAFGQYPINVIFENEVFFINLNHTAIFSAEKHLKTSIRVSDVRPSRDYYTINNLYVYNPLLQRTKIKNPCPKLCPLCLLRPSSVKGSLNYTCVLPRFTLFSNLFNIRSGIALVCVVGIIVAFVACRFSYKNRPKQDNIEYKMLNSPPRPVDKAGPSNIQKRKVVFCNKI